MRYGQAINKNSTTAKAGRTVIKTAEPAAQAFPPLPHPQQNTDDASGATQLVTKCVVNGKTSYGDGPCAQGAIASQVMTRRDHNLIAAVRPESVSAAQTEQRTSPRSAAAQKSPAVYVAAARKAECKSLDAEIERLDSLSRQPQSPQMHDWIREERKKARDRQFRLSCG